MDIQSVRTLIELKALQGISTDQSTNSMTESDDSLFDSIFSELLTNNGTSLTDATNQLGAVATLLNSTVLSNSTNSTIVSNQTNYLANFLLNNGQATPASIQLSSYKTDYTSQNEYSDLLAGASTYSKEISKAAATYNVPEKLIAAVMKQESNFNANAKSSAGATGLMQLMPSTAKYLGVKDSTNPEQNIMGGAKYLRQMLDQFDNNTSLALAAYNAGPGNVKKYNGIPPFKETQNYVKNVMNYYQA
jgi:soluble lytic murein transglycosylase-like protein